LSILLHRKGELEEAETLARHVAAFHERHHGPETLDVAFRRIFLAQVRLDRGDPVEAERLLRRGHGTYRRLSPRGRLDEAGLLNRLAYIVVARDAPDADRFYGEAIEFNDARPVGAPVFVTGGFHFLAWAQHRKGDHVGAEASYRRALGLYRQQLPNGHAYRAAAATGLGAVLLDGGRAGEAERYLREGLVQWQGHSPPDPDGVAEARALLARAIRERSDATGS
jgi:tetratricopeptide (TPR) repeat protein